ncbi:PREDICTED: pentatricopeptide repeat-containing protein At5g03800 [Camelina sativa]|uniref:Pentatricopeptide repeat-containing protein At5g03800 n=1 Tax=Camelina sativa TaxID=90675 RepID=A0ABM0TBC7_CAMSA|nr:PREDICTED: pentatricopeptide repeat-containing protein At5g03800 [Camelina sativa]
MSTVNHHCLLNVPHIPPSIPRPKLHPSLSLYRKPERLCSLSASLSLSPVNINDRSSSSSSLFEKKETEEIESMVDGYFYLLRLSAQYDDVEVTRAVHASFLKLRVEKTRLGNALISTYLKLGFPREAFLVFVSMTSPTVVSYTALISGFSRLNLEIEALKVFFRMRKSGIVQPNEFTFVAILTACVRASRFSLGIQIHGLIVKLGFLNSVFVCNSLMSLYAKGSSCDDVLKLFDEIPQRDVTSWNTVISSLVKEGMTDKAFDLFYEMNRVEGLGVDRFTLSTLLSSSDDLLRGRELHGRAIRIGLMQELSVNNALIGFYSKFGDIEKVESLYEMMMVQDAVTSTEMITAYMAFGMVDSAVEIFEDMTEKNTITYNALMAGFCRNGHGLKALKLFTDMLLRGVELTDFSLTSAVDACGLVSEKKVSEQIHGFCIKFGCLLLNPCIQTALLDMCTRCERMADAEEMFDQWPSNLDSSKATTSILGGYARNGLPDKAVSLFHRTLCEEKLLLDEVSLTLILAVCGTLGFRELGYQIHCYALKGGYFSNVALGNSLISMYSKCWDSDDAIKVFKTMQDHDVVSWNSLISCYILQRNGDEALALWSRMNDGGIKPDKITLTLVISAFRYTESNKLSSCRDLFLSMKTVYDIEPTTEHYTAFVRVLGHWGLLEEAEDTINSMPFLPEVSVLRALLDSCRVHSNTSVAKRVAKLILSTKPESPSEYILKSNIYSASGLWHRSEIIREEMRERGYRKHPAKSWIIHENKVHSFHARDTSHPQEKDIYSGLEILIMECLKAGYEPNTEFVLQEVDEFMKKSFLFHHSAKLAVTYGILTSNTRGKPVRVVKNVMLCGDCHEFFKYISVVVKKEIVLRDSSGFHHFVNGKCSCRDRW